MKKIKHSFAIEYDERSGDSVLDVSKIAKALLNWGDIPKRINNTRAKELSILAKSYLGLLRKQSIYDHH